MPEIILASASPRRRELLALAGFPFTVHASDCDETLPDGILPQDAVQLLAQRKGRDVLRAAGADCVVVSADTVVALDGVILGKPADDEDAARMMRMLSGKEHEVFTGVFITDGVRETLFYARTSVRFYPLTEREIADYVATGEPADKAGAYGIQGKGCLLCEEIRGDYFNIVGLPVARTARALRTYL